MIRENQYSDSSQSLSSHLEQPAESNSARRVTQLTPFPPEDCLPPATAANLRSQISDLKSHRGSCLRCENSPSLALGFTTGPGKRKTPMQGNRIGVLGVVSTQQKAKLLCFFFSWRSWCFFNLWSSWCCCSWSCCSCTASAGCTATARGGCGAAAARSCTAAAGWLRCTAWLCFAARLSFAAWLCFAAGFLLAALHLCWLALFDLALHWLALDWLAAVLCFSGVGQQHCCQRDDQTEVSHDFNPSFSIRHL